MGIYDTSHIAARLVNLNQVSMTMNARPFVLFAVPLLALGCGDGLGPGEPITRLPRELSVAEAELIESDNRFAFKLFREVNAQDTTGGDIFISPLSVAMALGMTYNGARAETRAAMEEVLELEGLDVEQVNEAYRSLIDLLRGLDPQVRFQIANSIWYREGLPVRQEFIDLNRTYFDALVTAMDFRDPGAPDVINDWVSDNTNGLIREIIDGIPADIVMYLINAIYFKGTWVYEFDKDRTRDDRFVLAGGGERQVPMMEWGAAAPVGYYVGSGFRAVDLAYGGGAYSMTILLPDPGRDIGVFARRLTNEDWAAVVDGLETDSVEVVMPKFRLEYDLTMNDVLAALGMGIAFEPYRADLSGIGLDPGDLYIDRVKHKTFVEVDEEGTEAAAVTSVGVRLVCACGPPQFRVDRPFVFAIRERYSGTILFMGKIMDPSAN